MGDNGSHDTNKLVTCRKRDVAFSMKLYKIYRRVDKLPPMKTAYTKLMAVSTSDGEDVVVIGSDVDSATTGALNSRIWCELTQNIAPTCKPQYVTISYM